MVALAAPSELLVAAMQQDVAAGDYGGGTFARHDFKVEAARGVRDHNLSFWEAQIWATAKLNQIPVVLSQDFTSGSVVEGVRFLDPFAAYFNLKE